ncbi:hypothetical protein GGTG_08436 [Gaeumannomyces tritici R3-111a-1]|uniref:Uncharacterized protein n=1 Tax=Gaeumannomyces tritici (strain R3-111a-1) TaxID=644352 RepID=J3P4J9_GAET3|nr:hypothetical protein GGTG_08436 [Gaeumannomyces tritici R3-111a-1]EJT74596.1 hypothetical protein GGTG_08436 [Gaeumannomyces tritici R3-111a-1]
MRFMDMDKDADESDSGSISSSPLAGPTSAAAPEEGRGPEGAATSIVSRMRKRLAEAAFGTAEPGSAPTRPGPPLPPPQKHRRTLAGPGTTTTTTPQARADETAAPRPTPAAARQEGGLDHPDVPAPTSTADGDPDLGRARLMVRVCEELRRYGAGRRRAHREAVEALERHISDGADDDEVGWLVGALEAARSVECGDNLLMGSTEAYWAHARCLDGLLVELGARIEFREFLDGGSGISPVRRVDGFGVYYEV